MESSRRLLSYISNEDLKIGEAISDHLKKARRIVIGGHDRPDGDCLGCEIALCGMLRRCGHEVEIINNEKTPERYRFMDPEGFARKVNEDEVYTKEDVVLVVDTTELERTGQQTFNAFKNATLINIDHHISNLNFGDLNWVDPGAAAAGELIWRLAACMGWKVPSIGLQALYVALVTDTGQFSYGNTSPRAMRMAADLIAEGVDPESVWRMVYLNKSAKELALETRARSSLEFCMDGRIASVGVTVKDFEETETDVQVTTEFTNIPRSVAGVLLAMFFCEVNGGKATKVSIRSIREIDACKLAQTFGGGGHPQAAGCLIQHGLDNAKLHFKEVAEKFVTEYLQSEVGGQNNG